MAELAYAGEGQSIFDFFFLNHLAKKNNVYLLTFGEKPYLVPDNVHSIRISEPIHPSVSPLKGLYTYGASFLRSILLKRELEILKPDVLISSGAISYGFYAALSNYRPNILLVWGSDILIAPKLLPFRFMAKFSLNKADAVVADSKTEEKACVTLGYDVNKIVKFPWVDLEPMLREAGKDARLQKMSREALREKMRWHKGDPVIISTRHHEAVYNVESLIQAIPLVAKEVKNARFLILGGGSLTQELKKRVHVLGVEDNVKFVGRVPHSEIPKYLTASDIYVSTSLSDGTSASLLEAMACRLPSIVTNIEANREWIENERTGVLVPTRSPKSLAEHIINLLKNPEFSKYLGIEACNTVITKADWRKNSKILDSVIFSLTSNKRR